MKLAYFKNRKQIVKLGDFKSIEIENNFGVPQGTAKLFADDTLVYVVANTVEKAEQRINNDKLKFTKNTSNLCKKKNSDGNSM